MEITTMTVVHHLGTWRDVKRDVLPFDDGAGEGVDAAVIALLHRTVVQFGVLVLVLMIAVGSRYRR